MQGTAKRWEVVTAYVRTRTTEEVLDMVKLGLKSRQSKAKADQFSIAKKRQANTSIKSDPTGRMESFSDVDINISGLSALQCHSQTACCYSSFVSPGRSSLVRLIACKRLKAWVASVGSRMQPWGSPAMAMCC